jgi:hypothetical protein
LKVSLKEVVRNCSAILLNHLDRWKYADCVILAVHDSKNHMAVLATAIVELVDPEDEHGGGSGENEVAFVVRDNFGTENVLVVEAGKKGCERCDDGVSEGNFDMNCAWQNRLVALTGMEIVEEDCRNISVRYSERLWSLCAGATEGEQG